MSWYNMTFSLLYSGSGLASKIKDMFYFLLGREQQMSRSETKIFPCAQREDKDQHSPSLIRYKATHSVLFVRQAPVVR